MIKSSYNKIAATKIRNRTIVEFYPVEPNHSVIYLTSWYFVMTYSSFRKIIAKLWLKLYLNADVKNFHMMQISTKMCLMNLYWNRTKLKYLFQANFLKITISTKYLWEGTHTHSQLLKVIQNIYFLYPEQRIIDDFITS